MTLTSSITISCTDSPRPSTIGRCGSTRSGYFAIQPIGSEAVCDIWTTYTYLLPVAAVCSGPQTFRESRYRGDSSAITMKTWVIVGASRGIGHEFARQALKCGDRVLATVRKPDEQTVSSLWPNAQPQRCQVFACDMLSEGSIKVPCSHSSSSFEVD